MNYDLNDYYIVFNEDSNSLQIVDPNLMKLISKTKLNQITLSNIKCFPLTDSKFVCSTGSFLQIFDAKHMNRNYIKIMACSNSED